MESSYLRSIFALLNDIAISLLSLSVVGSILDKALQAGLWKGSYNLLPATTKMLVYYVKISN